MHHWLVYYFGVVVVPACIAFPIVFLPMKYALRLMPLHRQWLPFLISMLAIALADILGAQTGLVQPMTTAMAVLRIGAPFAASIAVLATVGRRIAAAPEPAQQG